MRERLSILWQRSRGLRRFKEVHQEYYNQARDELMQGKKQTHWMWFIFPQSKGLGTSRNSQIFALSYREARRYWHDSYLSTNTYFCFQWVEYYVKQHHLTLEEIFGDLDAQKFRSFLALFSLYSERVADFAYYLAFEEQKRESNEATTAMVTLLPHMGEQVAADLRERVAGWQNGDNSH